MSPYDRTENGGTPDLVLYAVRSVLEGRCKNGACAKGCARQTPPRTLLSDVLSAAEKDGCRTVRGLCRPDGTW